MPPHVTIQKTIAKVRRDWGLSRERKKDSRLPTYVLASGQRTWAMTPRGGDFSKALSFIPEGDLLEKSGRVLAHQFNLLGSGWVGVKHGVKRAGLEGKFFGPDETVAADSEGRWLFRRINEKNSPESQRIWGLVEQNYEPIDWQLDFKSGFRWDEKALSRDIVYGDKPDADVKVPWELARMQHLSCLAWAYGLSKDKAEGFESPEVYPREFRNQVLDFIAQNPPRYGVNWVCTMDVAIRVANWVLAYDLFRSLGAPFDPVFEEALARSVYEHAHHIFNHLEWDPVLRGNHYLADIAGLLWATAHLPENKEAAAWFSFAAGELAKEVPLQFHAEGSNFEASTSYHRLSAEMVVYSTALLMGLQKNDAGFREILKSFTPDFWDRFRKMPRFTLNSTLAGGGVAQVGDNDSGRFFKLFPFEENSLDHRHLVAAFNGLLNREDFRVFAEGFEAETEAVRGFSGGAVFEELEDPAPKGGKTYPDFGLYRLQKRPWDLIIRCGPVGQKGNGGHAHNDQLSFELSAGKVSLIVDPGTYVYTPLPEERNRFRSTAMHNTLVLEGMEQNTWEPGPTGLFQMKDRAKARMVQFDHKTFVGEHEGFGVITRRTLNLKEGQLEGIDECAHPGEKAIYFHLAPGCQIQLYPPGEVEVSLGSAFVKFTSKDARWSLENGCYSKAYGEKEPAHVLVLRSSAQSVAWKIQNRNNS